MLYVLGILGSPRRQGNSEILLDQALAGAQKEGAGTEKIVLSQLKLIPCNGCDRCLESGGCPIKDDMASLYPKLEQADRLIFSFPIYFAGLPAQAKAFVDRCQALWAKKVILKAQGASSKRLGLWIAVAGRKKTDFAPARATVKAFFSVCRIKLVGELVIPGVDGYQEVLKQEQILKLAFLSGAQLAGPEPALLTGSDLSAYNKTGRGFLSGN